MPPREHVQSLLLELELGSHAVQLEALRKLRHLNYPEVVEAVTRTLLANTRIDVRAEAASCLGAFGDATSIPALLAVLNEGPEIRNAALASLSQLVGVHQLPLLHLPHAKPAPTMLREAVLQAASHDTGSRSLWGNRLDPVQRWATEVLTDLRDHGTPEALPQLCAALDHQHTPASYYPLLLKTLVGIARRHPEADLRPARNTLGKLALIHTSNRAVRKALRELDTPAGVRLPIPAPASPAHKSELPIPASSTSPAPKHSSAVGIRREAQPAPLLELTVLPDRSARDNLIAHSVGAWIFPLSCGAMSYLVFHSFWHPAASLPLLLAAFVETMLRISFSARFELPTETLLCRGHQLMVVHRLGPWEWRRNVTVSPGGRVHPITEKRSRLRRLLIPITASCHLACWGADGRPFRFAHRRTPEELDRLAAEINAYLEQQETVAPALSLLEPEPQRQSEPAIPAQVNRHAP